MAIVPANLIMIIFKCKKSEMAKKNRKQQSYLKKKLGHCNVSKGIPGRKILHWPIGFRFNKGIKTNYRQSNLRYLKK